MSKSDQNAARTAATNQQTTNNANEGKVEGITSGILGTAQGNASSLLPGITAGYSDLAGTGGGTDPMATAAYSNLAGGTSQATDLANTGGLSPASIQAMKDEASRSAASAYSTGKDQAARTASATGGYGDTSAVQALLARKGSEAASQGTVSANASIAGMQQQGKIAGTGLLQSGMAAGASGLAQQQQNVTGNKLAALGGSTNVYGMNESQITATVSQILQNYQQTGQMNNQDLAILTNLANQPGVFDKIIGTIGTLSGSAAGVMKAVSPTGFLG